MDPVISNTEQQISSLQTANTDNRKSPMPIVVMASILVSILMLFIGYFVGTKGIFQPPLPTPSPTNSPNPSTNWLTAYTDSVLALQYPSGWHVYRQYILSEDNAPITTYINSQPIYYSDPNEGNVADITVTTRGGYQDPQTKYNQVLQVARNDNHLTESTFVNEGLTFQKFEGGYSWDGGNIKILKYYVLTPSNTPQSRQIISFELSDRGTGDYEENSQVLDYIIKNMSYKN
jgi:hypothetical protein